MINKSEEYPTTRTPYTRARITRKSSSGSEVGNRHKQSLEEESHSLSSTSQIAQQPRQARATGARALYNWPALSDDDVDSLFSGYTEVTGLPVTNRMHRLLIVCARIHGPDVIPLMSKLHGEAGGHDLLARLKAHPPRPDPERAEPTDGHYDPPSTPFRAFDREEVRAILAEVGL